MAPSLPSAAQALPHGSIAKAANKNQLVQFFVAVISKSLSHKSLNSCRLSLDHIRFVGCSSPNSCEAPGQDASIQAPFFKRPPPGVKIHPPLAFQRRDSD